jgi:hypothetical protein
MRNAGRQSMRESDIRKMIVQEGEMNTCVGALHLADKSCEKDEDNRHEKFGRMISLSLWETNSLCDFGMPYPSTLASGTLTTREFGQKEL